MFPLTNAISVCTPTPINTKKQLEYRAIHFYLNPNYNRMFVPNMLSVCF